MGKMDQARIPDPTGKTAPENEHITEKQWGQIGKNKSNKNNKETTQTTHRKNNDKPNTWKGPRPRNTKRSKRNKDKLTTIPNNAKIPTNTPMGKKTIHRAGSIQSNIPPQEQKITRNRWHPRRSI